MYELFKITSASGQTPVLVTADSLAEVAARYSGLAIVDSRFAATLKGAASTVIPIVADEEHKGLDEIPAILKACRDAGLTREGRILAVGGGIIQDISSFVASIYMRGIAWDYIPTTLLAMADSCIGGKSSINVGPYKNLAGTFHPPTSIVIAPSLVSTLSTSQVVSGLCEASKICYAKGSDSFAEYLKLHAAYRAGDADALTKLISLSLACKKWFIEIDEFDRKERLLLNFAHSFGHAIESATKYDIEHGVAVGVGMLAALSYSQTFHPGLVQIAETRELKRHVLELLAQLPEIGEQLDRITQPDFTHYFANDKKHTTTNFRPVLLTSTGRLERVSIPRETQSEQAIWSAFRSAREQLQTRLGS